MLTFLRAGGFTIWVVLLFALLLLVVAGRYALWPRPKGLATVKALTLTLLFSALAGATTNAMATMYHTTQRPNAAVDPEFHLYVLLGLGESVTPLVLGFTALSLAWLFVAVGIRRRPDSEFQS